MTRRPAILVRLALRNLRRQMRRTLLTSTAMIVGGALLMFSLSLGDGTHEAWIDSAVRMGSGHVLVQAPGFQSSRKIEDRLATSSRRLTEEALTRPEIAEHVVTVSPQFSIGGLASSPNGARPVRVMAVDPEPEAEFTILDEKGIDGRYLASDDGPVAYVAAGLVQSLELRIGSRLVLTAQAADGEIAALLVRVVGVFRTGVPEIDDSLVQIPLTAAGGWLGTGDDVSTIAILLDSADSVASITRALRRVLGDAVEGGALTVMSWRESSPELDAAVRIDDFGNYMFQGILFTIIALGIVNTVLMSVLHRYREFGVLQALGLTPRQTGSVVLLEGLILTVVTGLVGIGLGLFVTWYFWGEGMDISAMWSDEWSFAGVVMDPVIVPSFRSARVIQALSFMFLIGFTASIYPAIRASHIDVTEAMKFER